jgi:hypothetical protein
MAWLAQHVELLSVPGMKRIVDRDFRTCGFMDRVVGIRLYMRWSPKAFSCRMAAFWRCPSWRPNRFSSFGNKPCSICFWPRAKSQMADAAEGNGESILGPDRKTARKRWAALIKQVYETDSSHQAVRTRLPALEGSPRTLQGGKSASMGAFRVLLLDPSLQRAIFTPIVKKQIPIPYSLFLQIPILYS